MSLTVKAFLAKNGQWDAEIRRFQVPADVSSSYDYLYKKLCEIFPSLKRGNFSLFWKGQLNIIVVLTDSSSSSSSYYYYYYFLRIGQSSHSVGSSPGKDTLISVIIIYKKKKKKKNPLL